MRSYTLTVTIEGTHVRLVEGIKNTFTFRDIATTFVKITERSAFRWKQIQLCKSREPIQVSLEVKCFENGIVRQIGSKRYCPLGNTYDETWPEHPDDILSFTVLGECLKYFIDTEHSDSSFVINSPTLMKRAAEEESFANSKRCKIL